ncbi:MAG: GNAT family N-acetyltransferase [Rhodanobacter sp.]
MKSFSCETAGLQLRPLMKDDEPLFHALYSHAETMRFLSDPWTPSEVTKRFQKTVARQERPTLGNRYLVIVGKGGLAPMGICGTSHYDPVDMRLEVGVMLLPAGRGLGVGKEALTALVGRAFEEPLVDEVYARVAADNIAMKGLLVSVGFRPAGSVKDGGQKSAMCEWSLHRSIWCVSKSTTVRG